MSKILNTPFGSFKRYWFECENGRRWTEADLYGQLITKDGDICNFSGCLQDHKVKLVKTTINTGVFIAAEEADLWFRGWDKWEDSPMYKSLQD